jgi:thiamine pyrophosphate-dependent acetolactate synthase large subunit-like protein
MSTANPQGTAVRMRAVEALQVLSDARGPEQVVVTNQGSARVWPAIQQHPLDFHYNPSTMGGAVPFALGLALASATRKVLVVSGDGAVLMSLGSLVSVVASGVRNLTVVVLDNGIYEVTGGQKTPAAGTDVNFAGIARAVGFPTADEFRAIALWRTAAPGVLSAPGPRFISLKVEPMRPNELAITPVPLDQQLERLRRALP